MFSYEFKLETEELIDDKKGQYVNTFNDQKQKLLWGRLITERYGGVATGQVFIFSKILKRCRNFYEGTSKVFP